jgi:hypothetical protein
MTARPFKYALFMLLALVPIACAPSGPTPSPADVDREEQAIYASFFSEGAGTAVILRNTGTFSADDSPAYLESITSGLDGLSKETLASFVGRNQNPAPLTADMQLGVPYVLLTEEELAEISSQPDWGKVLSERYPNSGGYKVFSRAGFNRRLDQALVYVAHIAGPLMGGGFYYLMEKQDGRWIIKDQSLAWIS